MKKLIIKIMAAGLAIILLFAVAGLAGCGDRERFDLTVTVDRTVVSYGDTITVTATLTNLRGRVRAEIPGWLASGGEWEKEEIVEVRFVCVEENYVWFFRQPGVPLLPVITIERNEVITRVVEHTVSHAGNFNVHAGAFFFIVGRTNPPQGRHSIIDPIEITVL